MSREGTDLDVEEVLKTAIVTGASRGLGLAIARGLAERGWRLVIDARDREALEDAAAELALSTEVRAISGDVTVEDHRRSLVAAVDGFGRLDALINNAGVLGPSPPPPLLRLGLDDLRNILEINALAPLRLFQMTASRLEAAGGCLLNVTSEAAVEAFEGWGGYGSSKAALEHISRVTAREHPDLDVYWIDPGDLNTRMEQDGFPGEDVSDRPDPATRVPMFLRLLEKRPPSGRYRADERTPSN